MSLRAFIVALITLSSYRIVQISPQFLRLHIFLNLLPANNSLDGPGIYRRNDKLKSSFFRQVGNALDLRPRCGFIKPLPQPFSLMQLSLTHQFSIIDDCTHIYYSKFAKDHFFLVRYFCILRKLRKYFCVSWNFSVLGIEILLKIECSGVILRVRLTRRT